MELEPYNEEYEIEEKEGESAIGFDSSAIRILFVDNTQLEIWYRDYETELNFFRASTNRAKQKKSVQCRQA